MSEIDTVRCAACRGSKQVIKLGGMLGDCNTCDGTGKVKPAVLCAPAVVVESVYKADPIIAAVAKVQPETKVAKNGRAIYKRKIASV